MGRIRREEEIEEDDLEGRPLIEQLRELYGSNQAVATAAGAPTAAAAGKAWRSSHGRSIESWNALSASQRRRWEKAGGSPDRGLESYRNGLSLKEAGEPWTGRKPVSVRERAASSGARRSRQTFLRNLQRYEDGTRSPGINRSRLERLRDEKLRERTTAGSSLGGLALVFRDEGVTVDVDTVTMTYDGRERDSLPAVTFGGRARVPVPMSFVEAVRAGAWNQAAAIFWECWGDAYGAFLDPEDVEGLELSIGNRPGAYGFRRAA